MHSNLAKSLGYILQSEGGRVNDPLDPGGRTNEGITQTEFSAWLRSHGDAVRDVYTITPDEVSSIYTTEYWGVMHCDDLPSGVDYATMDFGVNSGCTRAVVYLQEIVGAAPDGHVGPLTLAAVTKKFPQDVIEELCDRRLAFLRQLSGWSHDGAGWSRRVATVRQRALAMVGSA